MFERGEMVSNWDEMSNEEIIAALKKEPVKELKSL